MDSGKGRFALPAPKWRQSGQEPDYRFSLANERTFLAWIRSALAMMAGGVVLVQFATPLSPRWLVVWTGVALTVLAGLMAVLAYRQWRANEIAMRHARPLPPSVASAVVAAWVAVVAVVMAATLWPR
jgi:putative membrane protein